MSLKVGVNEIAKTVNCVYYGVGGVAKKVTKIYRGVNGVAKIIYKEETEIQTATWIKIHYKRSNSDYTNWNIWAWADNGSGSRLDFTQEDDWGKIAIFFRDDVISKLGIIVRRSTSGNDWAEKDGNNDRYIYPTNGKAEIWIKQGDGNIYTTKPS